MAIDRPLTIFPGDAFRASRPDEAVARVCLGFTLYLDDCAAWAEGGAAEALRRFLDAAPKGAFQWATTSAIGEWKSVRSGQLDPWLDALAQRRLSGARHLLWFRMVDDVHAPRCAFSYREVDERRTGRTGFLQILLPPGFDHVAFRRLVLSLAACGSFWNGIAGYAASWNLYRKGPSFWPIHAWCRRYLGLDVQDPDVTAWDARLGLPGTGWMTFLGTRLAEALEIDTTALLERKWNHGVSVESIGRALLVQAGPAPDLGDLNILRFPSAYAEAAGALSPWLIAKPRELPGAFQEEKDTAKWMRRFVDPGGWS